MGYPLGWSAPQQQQMPPQGAFFAPGSVRYQPPQVPRGQQHQGGLAPQGGFNVDPRAAELEQLAANPAVNELVNHAVSMALQQNAAADGVLRSAGVDPSLSQPQLQGMEFLFSDVAGAGSVHDLVWIARERLNEVEVRRGRKLNRLKHLSAGKKVEEDDRDLFDEYEDALTFLLFASHQALSDSQYRLPDFVRFFNTVILAARQEDWNVVVIYIKCLRLRFKSANASIWDRVDESLLSACRHAWEHEKAIFDKDRKTIGPCFNCEGPHILANCPELKKKSGGGNNNRKSGAEGAKGGKRGGKGRKEGGRTQGGNNSAPAANNSQ